MAAHSPSLKTNVTNNPEKSLEITSGAVSASSWESWKEKDATRSPVQAQKPESSSDTDTVTTVTQRESVSKRPITMLSLKPRHRDSCLVMHCVESRKTDVEDESLDSSSVSVQVTAKKQVPTRALTNHRVRLSLMRRKQQAIFRAQERRRVAIFRERAIMSLARNHYPSQLPAILECQLSMERRRSSKHKRVTSMDALAGVATAMLDSAPPLQEQGTKCVDGDTKPAFNLHKARNRLTQK